MPSCTRSGRRSRSRSATALQPRVARRVEVAGAEQDRLRDPFRPQPLRGGLDPRVVPLGQHHAPAAGARPLQQGRAHAHFAKRARSASATAGWTSAETSPPNRATSRTRLELR